MKYHLALAFMGLPLFVWGWGDLGHQTVAEIAERNLTDGTKIFINGILGPGPLAAPAIWPDVVRGDKRFDPFKPFHFVEIPPGTTFDTKPKVLRDAYAVINARNLLKGNYLPTREHRMLMLRYLIHVVGDVHQPLHVGNGTDQGANKCKVHWVDPKTKYVELLNLHTLWDENLIDYIKYVLFPEYVRKKDKAPKGPKNNDPPEKRWFGYKEFADMIVAENPLSAEKKARIAETPVKEWFAEAQELHAKVVYPDEDRWYCEITTIDPKTKEKKTREIENSRIPTLGAEYAKAAAPEIQKQILKGGLRLAALLNDVAHDQDASAVSPGYLLRDLIEAIEARNR